MNEDLLSLPLLVAFLVLRYLPEEESHAMAYIYLLVPTRAGPLIQWDVT